MTCIGTFTATPDGFEGRLQTLTIYRELTIIPAEPGEAENAPDYRIHHGNDDGTEIGPEIVQFLKGIRLGRGLFEGPKCGPDLARRWPSASLTLA